MDYTIFFAVLLLQSSMILYPRWLNAVMFSNIPHESRMDAARHVPIASTALLLFLILFFDAVYKDHPLLFPAPDDAAMLVRYMGGIVLAVLGLLFCIWPARTLKWIVPPMRHQPVVAIEDNKGLLRFTKGIGIVQLVCGSYWLFRILE